MFSSVTISLAIIQFKQAHSDYGKMVFCYQSCSDLLWEKNGSSDREKLLKFEAEGREFAKFWDH